MTMAPTLAGNAVRSRRKAASHIGAMSLDAVVFAIAATVCVILIGEGGLEALVGAMVGALTARAPRTALSGAFAGMFVGALFAAFLHNALSVVFGARL